MIPPEKEFDEFPTPSLTPPPRTTPRAPVRVTTRMPYQTPPRRSTPAPRTPATTPTTTTSTPEELYPDQGNYDYEETAVSPIQSVVDKQDNTKHLGKTKL